MILQDDRLCVQKLLVTWDATEGSPAGSRLDSHLLGEKARECDKCLEYLNACRTLMHVQYDNEGNLDKDLNQRSATFTAHRHVHEFSLQQHFVFLKRLEAITAEVSYLYQQKIIKEKIADPAVIQRKKDYPLELQKAIEKQKYDARPIKERKALDARGKAIAELMKATGIPETIATTMIDEQLKKQGKVTA